MSAPSIHYERPIIGVTAYEEEAAWGIWRQAAALVPTAFVQALSRAGAQVILVPVQPDTGGLTAVVERLEGLLLIGGPDVAPERYGAEPHPKSQQPRHARDATELALLAAAEARDLPVLAVCRGMQLLNVARGGTLHQHLPDVVGHEEHGPTPGAFATHHVRVKDHSLLRRSLGWSDGGVPTHHHQGIEHVGAGLEAVAWAEDGTIEALEDPRRPFLLGIQWHPEAGDDLSLFEALVAAAGGVAAHTAEDDFPREP